MSPPHLFALNLSCPHLARAAALREVFATDAIARDRKGGKPSAQIALLKESGLLNLLIPAAHGGTGGTWSTALRIVREFAKVDGSVAHLYGYHFVHMAAATFRATEVQRAALFRRSAAGHWLWGNAVNTFSKSLFGRQDDEGVVLNGVRPFSSGSHVADRLLVAWEDEASLTRAFAVIEPGRAGVTIEHDWNGIGQRQTGSGRVSFQDVRIRTDEILGPTPPEDASSPARSLTAQLQQSVLLNVFIGTAQGALIAARDYTTTQSRPWVYSGVERHIDDPWIQRQYGELWVATRAATALADRALRVLDATWTRGAALTEAERGQAAIEIAAANALAGQTSLEITAAIFEVMGARSAVRPLGLDRFWRNARIHTLHNPVEYKMRNVGSWFLTGAFPEPSTFQ